MNPAEAEIGLGVSPFGRDRADRSRTPAFAEDALRAVLELAATSRIGLVDTRASHGDVERLLARTWPFPSPFRVTSRIALSDDGVDRLEARARRSLERMGLPRAWALIVDTPEDLLGPDGRELWARLERLKDEGFFQRLGVRAGPGDEPVLLARRFRPDLMQIAGGLLDQRLLADGSAETIADLGIEVHLRSPFAHGVLFAPREDLPASLQSIGPRLSRVRRTLAEAGADPLQAALAFARTRPGVSAVVVGVASPAELRAVLAAAAVPAPALDWSALSLDEGLAFAPEPARADGLSSAA